MRLAIVISIAIIAGCANYRPLVDNPGDLNVYERNLQECQRYADSVSPGVNAAVGALFGAGLSAVLATVAGGGFDRGASARVGAVLGGVGGATQGGEAQMNIIRQCLAGRGYRVLQ